MSGPLLSIVVPSYNSTKFIALFIESVLRQDYKNWELIIVDDVSQDGTVGIIKNYCTKDSRIKLFIRHRQPKGADTCRNIGIYFAKGKYCIIADSDDLFAPFCFNQRVMFMESHPEIDYSSFKARTVIISESGLIEKRTLKWGFGKSKNLLKEFLSARYPFAVWCNIYKSQCIKSLQWDEKIKIYQDFDFMIAMLLENKYAHAFDKHSREDYFYCVHSNSTSSSFVSNEKYESTKYLFKKVLVCLEKKGLAHYKKSFKHFFLLQYKRILIGGNKIQVIDFYNFICDCYTNDTNCRIKFLLNIWLRDRGDDSKKAKRIKMLFDLLFNPIQSIKHLLLKR